MATLQTARQPMRVLEPPGSPQGRVSGVKAWPREAEGPRAGLFVFPSPAALIRWEMSQGGVVLIPGCQQHTAVLSCEGRGLSF